jgi:hypothetical protein
VLSDDDDVAAAADGGAGAAAGAFLKPSRVSVRWEAKKGAAAATAMLPAATSSSLLPAPPPPPADSPSAPLSGTVVADFFVEAPLADALPLTEEDEEEEGGKGGGGGDNDDGQTTAATSASASSATPLLVSVRFLGPFAASSGVPTTLCWRLERLMPSGKEGESSSSFRFEVRVPRGGGWELPGSATGEEEGEEEEQGSSDDNDDDGGEERRTAAVGGTVRLRSSPGSSAVVEASWTPTSPSLDSSASSSSASPSPLRAPTLVVFSSSDGKEVGRSGGGGSFGAGAGAGPSEEFVFVGGR